MKKQEANDLILQIGRNVIEDSEYEDDRWQSIALVSTLANGQSTMMGYQYFADGGFEAASPEEFGDILEMLIQLRDMMKADNGEVWKTCIMHITKPDNEVKMQFEYDDVNRWKPQAVSLDMSAFANSLRPHGS